MKIKEVIPEIIRNLFNKSVSNDIQDLITKKEKINVS